MNNSLLLYESGWKKDILPEYVIYLDVDTVVAHISNDGDLYSMIEPLRVSHH